MPEPVQILLHIPKTGGNSCRAVFDSVYGRGWRDVFLPNASAMDRAREQIPPDDLNELLQPGVEAVGVNGSFGVHDILGRPGRYHAVLREPLARVVSYWNFAHRTRDSKPRWSIYEAHDLDVRRLVEEAVDGGLLNDQVRVLSGCKRFDVDTSDLETAKRNILRDFAFVSRLPDLDQALPRYFGSSWLEGWEVPHFNRGDDDAYGLTPSDLSYLRDINDLDCALYEWFSTEARDAFEDARFVRG